MDRGALSRFLTGFSQGGAQGMNILRRIEELQRPETPGSASLAASGRVLPTVPMELSRQMPLPRLNANIPLPGGTPTQNLLATGGPSPRPAELSSQRLRPILRSLRQGGRDV